MAELACRECGNPVRHNRERCPSCGCRSPYSCASCAKVLSSYTLRVRRSGKYPLGSYTREGLPLCREHRLTRCYGCKGLFAKAEMKTVRRRGTHAAYCQDCEVPAPTSEPLPRPSLYAWSFFLIIFAGLCLVGWLALLLYGDQPSR